MLVMLGEPDDGDEGQVWQLPRYAENIRGPLETIAERISTAVLSSSVRSETPLKLVN
jgi:hypothetical protein